MGIQRTYHFIDIADCNMCGRPAGDARVIGGRLNRSQGLRPRQRKGIGVSICRCRGCGLIFPNPQPQPMSLSDHYGVPPESYWKEAYFAFDPDYFSRTIRHAKELTDFRDGMTALDIGAGIGKASLAMKNAGFEVWGLEPSEPFRQRAIANTGLPEERLIQAPVEAADLPEGSFDFVTFGAVLEHLYDPSAAIARALDWLKPGGVVHIEVPSSDWLLQKIIDLYYTFCLTNYSTHISPMHAPFHIYEFTLKSFLQNGEKMGYDVVRHYYDVAGILHFPKLAHPVLREIMKCTDTGMQLTVWLRR